MCTNNKGNIGPGLKLIGGPYYNGLEKMFVFMSSNIIF
jgi:hypothetical protein